MIDNMCRAHKIIQARQIFLNYFLEQLMCQYLNAAAFFNVRGLAPSFNWNCWKIAGIAGIAGIHWNA